MRLRFALLGLFLPAACYSMGSQDTTAVRTIGDLDNAAACRLSRVAGDDDAGDVAAARALLRAAHAEAVGVLSRNGGAGDAGVDALGVTCP